MWTPDHRRSMNRSGLRYPSDLRRRVGYRCAYDPTGAIRWTQTFGQPARGPERDFLRPVDRVPMEGIAERPATEEHGARLSRTLELGRNVGAHPSRTLCRGPRAGGVKPARRPQSIPDGKGRPKRGASLDPSGYDAGKKITLSMVRYRLVHSKRNPDCARA